MSGTPYTILGQFGEVSRGTFSAKMTAEFPAGGVAAADQKPIINWAMDKYPYSERVGGYIDLGATDPARNLDVLMSANAIVQVYADEVFKHDQPPQLAGVNPPKAVLFRCLAGSGLLYINILPVIADPPALDNKQTPLPLHAGSGLFYYTFPKKEPWRTIMTDPDDPLQKIMMPSALIYLGLRTFEDSNRFHVQVFR